MARRLRAAAPPSPRLLLSTGLLLSCVMVGLRSSVAFLLPHRPALPATRTGGASNLDRPGLGLTPRLEELGCWGVRRVAAGRSGRGGSSGVVMMALELSVMSANVLAPIYFRVDKNGTREATMPDRYLARHQLVLHNIVTGGPDGQSPPDVVCLQVSSSSSTMTRTSLPSGAVADIDGLARMLLMCSGVVGEGRRAAGAVPACAVRGAGLPAGGGGTDQPEGRRGGVLRIAKARAHRLQVGRGVPSHTRGGACEC